jgi:hypothetical protein
MPVFALQRSPAGATPFCRDPRIRQIRRDGEAPLASAGPTMHPIAADPNNLARVVWTSLGPLPRWVPGPTTRWAPGTTRLALHGT